MANYKKAKSDRGKIFKAIGILVLIVVLFCSGVVLGFGGGTNFTFKRGGIQLEQPDNQKPDDGNVGVGGGAIITPDDDNDGNDKDNVRIQVASRKLAQSEYEMNGVSEEAESAYELTATVTPEYATFQEVEWSVMPEDGKVTVKSTGDLSATVQVMGAFDTQHTITVRSVKYPDKSASCKVDYLKALLNVNVEIKKYGRQIDRTDVFGQQEFEAGHYSRIDSSTIQFNITTEFGVGTVQGEVSYGPWCDVGFTDEFIEAIKNAPKALPYQISMPSNISSSYGTQIEEDEYGDKFTHMPTIWDCADDYYDYHYVIGFELCASYACSVVTGGHAYLRFDVAYSYGDSDYEYETYVYQEFKIDTSNFVFDLERIVGLEDLVAYPQD